MAEVASQETEFAAFAFGSVVERRDELEGRPWISYPVRVVADTPELVAVYLSHGTLLTFGDGPFSWGPHPWGPFGDRWQSAGILQLHRPGRGHSVWVLRDADTGAFREWYVNVEAPWRRTPTGFSTLDHEIDLVVPADSRTLRWKDVEKFEERAGSGTSRPRRPPRSGPRRRTSRGRSRGRAVVGHELVAMGAAGRVARLLQSFETEGS
nr:fomD protein - Streptomyces wedmorensis [Streptomyces wedmorensis]